MGVFLAGCRSRHDEIRLLHLLRRIWPQALLVAGDDALSGLTAAHGFGDGILVIVGTGSKVRVRRGRRIIGVGGWGHVAGDEGSGYWMGRETIHLMTRYYDRYGKVDALSRSVLRHLSLNTMDDLMTWSLTASKADIASITHPLFEHTRSAPMRDIVRRGAEHLAALALLASKKVGLRRPLVALNRGLALYQPMVCRALIRAIQRKIPGSSVFLAKHEGAVGSAMLAADAWKKSSRPKRLHLSRLKTPRSRPLPATEQALKRRFLHLSPTEQRNPHTLKLHTASISHLIRILLAEESRTVPAVLSQHRPLSRCIAWILASLRNNGRIIYVGAGTSGRMGILDASEAPPTFGVEPQLFQGIIAGGVNALHRSLEGREDDANHGCRAIMERGITQKDVVVGIAASGFTPFVLGALEEAHHRGARTILLTFNPQASFRLPSRFLRVAIPTGPEAITGSTRLKAGTATKLILNLFSTIPMIRLGHVRSNLMVHVKPTNEKLKDRAIRIISTLHKISYDSARHLLIQNDWNMKAALSRR